MMHHRRPSAQPASGRGVRARLAGPRGPASTGGGGGAAPVAAGVGGPFAAAAVATARVAFGLPEQDARRLQEVYQAGAGEAYRQAAQRAQQAAQDTPARRGPVPDVLDGAGVVSGAAVDTAVAVLVADRIPPADFEVLARAWRVCGLPLGVPAAPGGRRRGGPAVTGVLAPVDRPTAAVAPDSAGITAVPRAWRGAVAGQAPVAARSVGR